MDDDESCFTATDVRIRDVVAQIERYYVPIAQRAEDDQERAIRLITALVKQAVEDEREECAKILERNDVLYSGSPEAGYRREQRMADEIRGRT